MTQKSVWQKYGELVYRVRETKKRGIPVQPSYVFKEEDLNFVYVSDVRPLFYASGDLFQFQLCDSPVHTSVIIREEVPSTGEYTEGQLVANGDLFFIIGDIQHDRIRVYKDEKVFVFLCMDRDYCTRFCRCRFNRI